MLKMSSGKNIHHITTPLVYSTNLSKLINHDVYLKLENNQPSGSFKSRGMGYHCQKEYERGCRHLFAASAGNAGVAVANAGKVLNIPTTVYLPKSVPKLVFDSIKDLGKEAIVYGDTISEANVLAIEEGKKPGCANIHPYLHPETWEGHSSMIDEIAEQLNGERPGCILVAVGGGGLLQGLLIGMERHGWTDMPIFGLETVGADCFNQSLLQGRIVEQLKITSIAHTLGGRSIPPALFEMVKKFPNLQSHVVTDAQAVESCIRFLDDQRILVEPSCGAALATIYSGILQDYMAKNPLQGPVVVVVCGGTGINLSILANFAKQFNIPFPMTSTL